MSRTVAPASNTSGRGVLEKPFEKPNENPADYKSPEASGKTTQSRRIAASAFIASFSLTVALFTFVFFVPTEHDRQSFFSVCVDKHRLLEKTPTPRIVLTGGSNVTLGVDTNQLETLLGTSVSSLSSNTLMGLGYQLNEACDSAKRGDTIVVVPEYENWIGSFNGGEAQLMMPSLLPRAVFWFLPGYFYPRIDLERLGKNSFSAMKERFQRLFQVKKQAAPSSFHIGQDFNERGDFIGHLDMTPKPFDLTEKNAPDLRNYDLSAIRQFNKFALAAKQKGINVIVVPPVTTESYRHAKEEQLIAFWSALKTKLKCTVRTDFAKYALPDKMFWDCKYHPQRQGRQIRTKALASDLKSLLNQKETRQ